MERKAPPWGGRASKAVVSRCVARGRPAASRPLRRPSASKVYHAPRGVAAGRALVEVDRVGDRLHGGVVGQGKERRPRAAAPHLHPLRPATWG